MYEYRDLYPAAQLLFWEYFIRGFSAFTVQYIAPLDNASINYTTSDPMPFNLTRITPAVALLGPVPMWSTAAVALLGPVPMCSITAVALLSPVPMWSTAAVALLGSVPMPMGLN